MFDTTKAVIEHIACSGRNKTSNFLPTVHCNIAKPFRWLPYFNTLWQPLLSECCQPEWTKWKSNECHLKQLERAYFIYINGRQTIVASSIMLFNGTIMKIWLLFLKVYMQNPTPFYKSMALCKTAESTLLTPWRDYSLALSQRNSLFPSIK